jgi:hypothetical protein
MKRKDLIQHPPGNSHTTRRSATACHTEGTAVSEITTIMRMLDRIAVGTPFLFGYKEILRQHPPEAHTPRAEAPCRATQRERL